MMFIDSIINLIIFLSSMATNYWITTKNFAMKFKCGTIVKCAAVCLKYQVNL